MITTICAGTLILFLALWNLVTLLRRDGQLLNARDHLRGLRHLLGYRGMITRLSPGSSST